MHGLVRLGSQALVLLAVCGCARGCSCSPLARAEDPLAFIPADAAVVLEADLGRIGNHAIFRQIVTGLWQEDSCLVPLVLEDARGVVLALADVRPDGRTMPGGVITTGGKEPESILSCLNEELFPDAGSPEEEEYRGVRHWGHPERLPLRIGVVNRSMLLVGDRGGLHRMIDTFLDGGASLAGTDRFDEARGLLPEGAQIRFLAVPGDELRQSARTRFREPWSSMLDAEVVAAGAVFGDGELRLAAVSRTSGDAASLARSGNEAVRRTRQSKLAVMLGLSSLLAETRLDVSGKDLVLEARAPEKVVTRFVKGAGQLVEIGL